MSRQILTEEFKPVPGFPNYLVSNYGYILNQKRNKELNPTVTLWGHLQVGLTHKNLTKTFRVHRLVAQAFLHGYNDAFEVEHISDNKSDCAVTNLKMGKRKRGGRC